MVILQASTDHYFHFILYSSSPGLTGKLPFQGDRDLMLRAK